RCSRSEPRRTAGQGASNTLKKPNREEAMGSVNACVDLKRDGDVAIITIDNAPVNALRHEVRAGLVEALKQIKDPSVKAVVLDGELVPAAVAFARNAVGKPLQRVRDREDKIAAARANPASYDEAAAKIVGRARGRRAQSACVESVRNAFQLPFEDGLAREQA